MSEEINRDQIPDWNFKILINDFGDDYWDDDFESSHPEAFKALSNLNDVYGTIPEYEEAIEIYDKYIGEAEEFYGGKMAMKYLKKTFGNIKGYKKRPKLKSKLRKHYSEDVIYRTGRFYEPLTDVETYELDKKAFGDNGKDPSTFEYDYPYIDRNRRRAAKAALTNNILGRNKAGSEITFATDIISQIAYNYENNVDFFDNIDIRRDFSKRDLSDLSIEEHERLYDVEHEPQYNDLSGSDLLNNGDGMVYSMGTQSRYLNKLSVSAYVYRALVEANQLPFTKEELDNMSDARKKFYSSELGIEAVMTPHELKKYKKKRRKQMKQYEKEYKQHQAVSSRALAAMMTSHKRSGRIG